MNVINTQINTQIKNCIRSLVMRRDSLRLLNELSDEESIGFKGKVISQKTGSTPFL